MTDIPLNQISETILEGWTVFDHPVDEPDWYVARRWIAHRDGTVTHTRDLIRAKQLRDLRAVLESEFPNLIRTPRMKGDEPHIVEVWI